MLRGTEDDRAGCGACALALPAAAASAKVWIVKGAGFGHGVGMSQYGAYGYAKNGFGYREILAHYYTGTTVGPTADQTVRVLLRDDARSVNFRGAGSACGAALKPGKGYVAKQKGAGVVVRSKKGRVIARCGPTMTAAGAPTVIVAGKGTYRGSLEVRGSSGGLDAINVVDLEDYVRGVVSKESPSSWPLEALKAQAVAARSYALSTAAHGSSFDVFDDTRSQAYGGVGAETAEDGPGRESHTSAGRPLRRPGRPDLLLLDLGRAHREQRVLLARLRPAADPVPAGRGRPIRGEAGSPYERWKRKFSLGRMNSALRGLGLRGKLRNIVVTQRGVSPRIVHANLIGTRRHHHRRGPAAADALGLPDTWAFFRKK